MMKRGGSGGGPGSMMARGAAGGGPMAPAADWVWNQDAVLARASTIVRRHLLIRDLAAQLAGVAEQAPDAAAVTVTIAPYDLLRIARVLAPQPGGWPVMEAGRDRYAVGLVTGIAAGLAAAATVWALVLFLAPGAA